MSGGCAGCNMRRLCVPDRPRGQSVWACVADRVKTQESSLSSRRERSRLRAGCCAALVIVSQMPSEDQTECWLVWEGEGGARDHCCPQLPERRSATDAATATPERASISAATPDGRRRDVGRGFSVRCAMPGTRRRRQAKCGGHDSRVHLVTRKAVCNRCDDLAAWTM